MLAAVLTAVVLGGGASSVGAETSPSSPAYTFVPHSIPTAPYDQVERANKAGDINGDGKPDLVIAGEKYLVWYENPTWTPHLIASGIFGVASLVALRDLSGDGRLDIVVGQTIPGAAVPRQMAWFDNKPSGWVRHTLSGNQSCHNLDFGDLNTDGLVDISCAGGSSEHVFWLQRPPNVLTATRWASFMFDERPVWGSKIADIDGDGKPDIVSGRAWYRNPGLTPSSSGTAKRTWTRHPYTLREDTAARTGWSPAYFNDLEEVSVLDVNGDSRPDIVASLFGSSPEGEVSVFLAPPNPVSGSWTEVPLDAGPLFSVHTQAAANYDGSGRPQIAVGEMAWGGYGFGHNPSTADIFIYRLEGPAEDPASWKKYTIASDDIGTHAADAIDVNGDGRLDLISGEENSGNGNPVQNGRPQWWENQTVPDPPINMQKPVVSGIFRAGEQVSATDGTWAGATSLARQWHSCDADGTSSCGPISGATANVLTIGSDQIGRTLVFSVTATNDFGSTPQSSDPSPLVDPPFGAAPLNTAKPTISALTFQEGALVTGGDGAWEDATSFSRQWYGCDADGVTNCQPIGGATTSTLELTPTETGRTVRFDVTASNSVGSSTEESDPSPVVAALPNRAPDGSFEVDPKTYYYGSGTGKFLISSTVSHDASGHSWEVDGSGTGLKRVISRYRYMTAQPGAAYSASAWFKTAAMAPSAVVCLQILFHNRSGSVIGKTSRSPLLTGTNDWTRISVAGTSPAKTAYVRIDAILDKGAGTVWYDDLYVNGPAEPPNPVSDLLAVPGDGKVTISWTKPSGTFDAVDVVRKASSDPADPSDGTLVYRGKLGPALDTGLANGDEYHYAVWAERDGLFSTPARINATPLAAIPVTYTAQPAGSYDASAANWTVGAVFHVTVDSTLTRLGKVFKAGSTAANTIAIWNEATQALLFSAVVSPAATAVDLPPLALQANKRYVLGIKEAPGTPWTKTRLLTGLPTFLVVDDSAFVNASTLTYPNGREGLAGFSNEDWTMTLTPGGSTAAVDGVADLHAVGGDGRVDLSWANPATAFDSVKVVRKLGADPADPSDGSLVCSCTGTSTADTGLTNGGDYRYGVWVARGSELSVPARTNATPDLPTPVTYTAQPPGSYSGTAANRVFGGVFHVTVDKTLTEVGKAFAPGSTAANTIGVWDDTTQTLLFSGTVSPAAPTIAVSPQLLLQAGRRYVIAIKEASGSPWSPGRLLTGLPSFLVIDDSAFLTATALTYPTGRDGKPGFSNEDWTMTFAP
jgi:VCBS repeat protein